MDSKNRLVRNLIAIIGNNKPNLTYQDVSDIAIVVANVIEDVLEDDDNLQVKMKFEKNMKKR